VTRVACRAMGADGSASAPRCGRNRRPAGTGASRLRGQMSLAVRVLAPAQKQHKPRARAKINTGVTRTKRHSPAYGGTRRTMAVSENLASSPAEMRVSWADYPFPGRWAKGDRPHLTLMPLSVRSSSRARTAYPAVSELHSVPVRRHQSQSRGAPVQLGRAAANAVPSMRQAVRAGTRHCHRTTLG
jgi:hypothetical protein